jgi:phosphocarrier protein FPr
MVSLLAPLSGVVWPLERIPDPVFAQKMVGDGASIDPTDAVLVAPCDGDVLSLHPAGHAVTLRTAEGAEILLHIGIDTVALKGQGFHPMVSAGETVRVGAPLISFDLDYLATHAKSLLTQIVITNGHGLTNWERATGQVVAGKDLLFSVNFVSSEKGGAPEAAETITSDAIVIPNPTGLHARPAAVLASLAKGFRSSIKLQLGDQQANARSITAIMALDVRSGAVVHLLASGPDARAAVDKIAPVIAQGLGDEGCTPASAPATTTVAAESAPPPQRKSTDPNLLVGVPCSPGLAVGQVFQVRRGMIEVTEDGAGVEIERGKLSAAIETAKGQLEALRAQLNAKADPAKAAIFAAHEELIEDPDLLEIVDSAIAKGKSADFGWKKAFTTHADRLAALRNPLLAQRANDLRDVGLRVLGILTGKKTKAPDYPPNTILIAEDLTPSDTAALDRTRVMGFATTRGGATSHGAILARSLGIPALAGVEPGALEIPNGTSVVLDGSKGALRLNPPPEEISARKISRTRTSRRSRSTANALKSSRTSAD